MISSSSSTSSRYGWPGEKVTTDMPTIVNIRQDPFERTPSTRGETLNNLGGNFGADGSNHPAFGCTNLVNLFSRVVRESALAIPSSMGFDSVALR